MSRFQKWALATTIATYLLIMVGGLVRASDAGLGCPEWPTCFGKLYPPFSQEELMQRDIPADFDIANYHITLGWIEWVNRLTGAVIGLLMIGTLVVAYRNHRQNKHIFYPVVLAFITVLFNGWLGGEGVVESGLKPAIITAHMLLALVQVSLLLYATFAAFFPAEGYPTGELPPQRKTLARGAIIVLLLALVQVGMGADVRGQLEVVEDENPQMERGDFIHEVSFVYEIHRSFSWAILIGVGWLLWYTHKHLHDLAYLRYMTQICGLLVLAQIAAGIGLAYVNLPPPLQVAHLWIASLLIGGITLVYLLATRLPIEAQVPMPMNVATAAAD